jgi:tRNA(Ile)-lysidine synthetase-like protein
MKRQILPASQKYVVAVSGGADSMAVLDFFRRGKWNIFVACFDHQTEFHRKAAAIVRDYCKRNSIEIVEGSLKKEPKPRRFSPEEYWRVHRYEFLRSFGLPCIVGHHLDDAVETWIASSLHGNPRLIPWRNTGIYRPFLLTTKQALVDYCEQNGVPFLNDPSNEDIRFERSVVRHKIFPFALQVNPGIRTTISKKLFDSLKEIVNNKS